MLCFEALFPFPSPSSFLFVCGVGFACLCSLSSSLTLMSSLPLVSRTHVPAFSSEQGHIDNLFLQTHIFSSGAFHFSSLCSISFTPSSLASSSYSFSNRFVHHSLLTKHLFSGVTHTHTHTYTHVQADKKVRGRDAPIPPSSTATRRKVRRQTSSKIDAHPLLPSLPASLPALSSLPPSRRRPPLSLISVSARVGIQPPKP